MLNQVSHQWHLKLHYIIVSFGFEANDVKVCTCLKFSGSGIMIPVLQVDEVLHKANNVRLLLKTKAITHKVRVENS